MPEIIGRNINAVFPVAIQLLIKEGRQQDSRNGPTVELPGTTMTVYKNPRERVLFSPERDCNPIFHLYESIWMLSGRDSVLPLLTYNPTMIKYATNGAYIHGAYGKRWAGQLDRVINILKADPDSRRAYVQLWEEHKDLGSRNVDIPCLAGDTLIWSPEGDITIKELAKRKTKYPVYTVDPSSGDMSLQWCTKAWKTGRRKTYKVTFDDGSSIRATDNHVFYKKTRVIKWGQKVAITITEEKLKDLQVGDRIWATHMSKTPKGHNSVKANWFTNTSFMNMKTVPRLYMEFLTGKEIPKDWVVHHKDEQKTNDSRSNIALITASEHNSIHRRGDSNPMRRLSPEAHRARAAKQGASLKANWAKRKAAKAGLANHKIVSIKDHGYEDVYDFTVPVNHNAVIGTGILSHNCNVGVAFLIRDGNLNMTVFNRSNDAIWGAYGANVVHFSFLQEYIADMVGVPVGTYTQISNSLHAYPNLYPNIWARVQRLDPGPYDPYQNGEVTPYSEKLVTHPAAWFSDIEAFMRHGEEPSRWDYVNPWFREVGTPMVLCHQAYRLKDYQGTRDWDAAFAFAEVIKAPDWRRATVEWLTRRKTAQEKAA